MKTLFAFACLFALSVTSFGQPVTTEGILSPAPNTEAYTKSDKTDEHKLMERRYTLTSNGKPVFIYSRQNDSSFMVTEFDGMGNIIRKGWVTQNNAKAMHYKIMKPDIVKDPDFKLGIMKDSILYDEYFDRNGYWEETMPDGSQWRGSYDHEVKQGLWEKVNPGFTGKEYVVDSFIVYQNGNPVSNSYQAFTASRLFEILNGSWFEDDRNQSREYRVFHRTALSPMNNEQWVFTSPGTLQIHSTQGINKAQWKFENNQFIVQKAGRHSAMTIVFLDHEIFVLRRLQE